MYMSCKRFIAIIAYATSYGCVEHFIIGNFIDSFMFGNQSELIKCEPT